MVADLLLGSREHFAHTRVLYQAQLLRQVAVEMSELSDEKYGQVRLAEDVVFDLWVQHALLNHQKEGLS